MWSNLGRLPGTRLLQFSKVMVESHRSTFILRRTREIEPNKLGATFLKKLKRPSYYYEEVENTYIKKKPLIDLVLVKDVPGIGMVGDSIKITSFTAYRDFLLPKLAIYADSPEAKNIKRAQDDKLYSSIYSKLVGNFLAEKPLQIFLNGRTKWTLEPWHVTLALQKNGIITSENCIIMPINQISGPDETVENKDFIIRIRMNNSEIFPVRCRIYHCDENSNTIFSDSIIDTKSKALFPEEQEEIDQLIIEQKKLQKTKQLLESNK